MEKSRVPIPPGFQPASQENTPISRYIPAAGEVRGQGSKVPAGVSGEPLRRLLRRCPRLPTPLGTAQSRQAGLAEQGHERGPLGTDSQPLLGLLPQSPGTNHGTGGKGVLSVWEGLGRGLGPRKERQASGGGRF